jgi:hypothetical protein
MNTDNLEKYEYNTYSQNGEDGILEEVFKRLGLDEFKLKKYFILTYTAKDINFNKLKKINFILSEVDKIIYKEYMKQINA